MKQLKLQIIGDESEETPVLFDVEELKHGKRELIIPKGVKISGEMHQLIEQMAKAMKKEKITIGFPN